MAFAQKAALCGAPPLPGVDAKANIFSPQQELWLGEAEQDWIFGQYERVHDPSLNAHLQQIVDRMAANLPEPHVPFHVELLESSTVNAFSIAGGSIFVTRKLAATAESDDELAGVLGHEMGHISTHQFALDETAELKRLLGVTRVGDRDDVYAKLRALIDAEMKDKHPPKGNGDDDEHQGQADRMGMYLMAAAGYQPQAEAEFFNRAFFVGGSQGNRILDLFGLTKPDKKRLRSIDAMIAALPAGCVSEKGAGNQLAFDQWRERVRADERAPVTTAAVGAGAIVKLTPPLQIETERVHFSPDGNLLLAQDESSVYVLKRSPLAVLFRIDAERAEPAYFSPDSKTVTFTTPGLHTEQWDVAGQKLVAVHEPVTPQRCVTAKLSPDGRTAVCLSFDASVWRMGLTLLDSSTGQTLWQKKDFFSPTWQFGWKMLVAGNEELPSDTLFSSFSSDGNFLVIGPADAKVAFDLRSRAQVKMGGNLTYDEDGPYAFLGSDRIALSSLASGRDSGIFSFPDGKRLKSAHFRVDDMEALSDPGTQSYVLTHAIYGIPQDPKAKPDSKEGFKDQAKIEDRVAIADLESGHYLMAARSTALDMWRSHVATEEADGSLAVAEEADGRVTGIQRVTLPVSPLWHLDAVDVSPDGRFLAYSMRDRGGIWDLKTGTRMALLVPFTNVKWTGDTTVVLDVEKSAKQDRKIMGFDLSSRKPWTVADTLVSTQADSAGMRYGKFDEWKMDKGSHRDLIVHSLKDGSPMWTKTFNEGFPYWTVSFGGADFIFNYPMRTDTAKQMIKDDPALEKEAAEVKKKDDGRVIEVVDAETGKTVATMAFELPVDYSNTDGLNRAGDRLYVTGADNRTRAYSLSTGKELWQTFGWVQAVDAATGRACVRNRAGEAIVFDADGKELLHTAQLQPILFATLRKNGTELVVLTSDQSVATWEIDAAGSQQASERATATSPSM